MMLRHENGFSYLMLLWWVAISGVTLVAIAGSWKLDTQREREAELRFRGEQIRNAVQDYYDSTPQEPKMLPERLEDLLEDRRGPTLKRHLRRLFKDPMTFDGEWILIRDGLFIKGVHSSSRLMPLQTKDPDVTYADLRFEADVASTSEPASGASAPSGPSKAASSPFSSLPGMSER